MEKLNLNNKQFRWVHVGIIFILSNACYAGIVFLPALKEIPLVHGAIINMIIFIWPGLAWASKIPSKKLDITKVLFQMLLLSTLVALAGAILFYILRIKMDPKNFVLYLTVMTNFGLFVPMAYRQGKMILHKKYVWVGSAIIFVFVYISSYNMAVNQIRPSIDHDLEMQGTSYGLLNILQPKMLTDRGGIYYWAHPLLAHFYGAESILLSGELPHMKLYYDFAQTGRKLLDASPQELDKRQILRSLVQEEYERFRRDPHLHSTRLSNVFLTALSGIVLLMLIFKITESAFMSFLGVLIYLSFPDVLILSSTEIYTALTILTLLFSAYFYITLSNKNGEEGGYPFLFLSGMFLALSNHKAVILPLAVIMNILVLRQPHEPWKYVFNRIVVDKLILGFILGLAVFWSYGLSVSPKAFVQDHIQYHLWNRIVHINDLGYGGYPGVVGLWSEFGQQSGYVFIVMAVLSVFYVFKTCHLRDKKLLIFPLWVFTGAVVFSLIDWRETKHLALIMPALLVCLVIFVSNQKGYLRAALLAGLFSIMINNFWFMTSRIADYNLYLNM